MLLNRSSKDKAAILMYHRISDLSVMRYPDFSYGVSKEHFERQMRFLREHMHPMSLIHIVDHVKNNIPLPLKAVAVTFDDGYADSYTNAYPILNKYNIPATIFLVTGYIGTKKTFWWDRIGEVIKRTDKPELNHDLLKKLNIKREGSLPLDTAKNRVKATEILVKKLRENEDAQFEDLIQTLEGELKASSKDYVEDHITLSWEQVRKMSENGIEFGAHTVTHPDLTNLPLKKVEQEIRLSKQEIENNIGKAVDGFCYPVGLANSYNEKIKDIIAKAGFKYACAAEFGHVSKNSDLFSLRRATTPDRLSWFARNLCMSYSRKSDLPLSKKRILMISYYFPPLVDVGSLRALGFSKNLPAFGWEPYVLSVKNPDKRYCTVVDAAPPENVKTYYSLSLFNLARITGKIGGLLHRISKIFGINLERDIIQDMCIPDIFIGWLPLTYVKALNLIRKKEIDAIYVSSKPFSSAIIGFLLKKSTNKPLILDFRDPASFPTCLFKTFLQKFKLKMIKKIETCILKDTDTLILTTDETKQAYMSIYPFLKDKIHKVYNGYLADCLPRSNEKPFEVFTIIYTGNFYYDLDPSHAFFEALRKAIVEQMVPKENIRFLYVGDVSKKDSWLRRIEKKYDLQDVIVTPGRVSRQESMKNISRSSMLLLRIVPPMISTKLYEGLAVGIPILATIAEGEVADLIRRYSKNSYIITSNSVDDIASAIKHAYDRWERGELEKSRNEEFLQNFHKRALTKQFAQILEEVYQANRFLSHGK